MTQCRPATTAQTELLEALITSGHILPTGVPGIVGWGEEFECIRQAVGALIDREGVVDRPEYMRFPPALPRHVLEDNGYFESFPHLAGTIFIFDGSEADATALAEKTASGEDWSSYQQRSDMALAPAACYPVYPEIARRGPLPAGGVVVSLGAAWVFRHEPAADPSRLQFFHQHEIVRIGDPESVLSWREQWRDRAVELLRSLGLDANAEIANDPFFGRKGRLLATAQRAHELKFEVTVPVGGDSPTAVASFNYHRTHFAESHGLLMADGRLAHTGCLGFGEERIVIALLFTHGVLVAAWPADVRQVLWPD